MALPPDLVDVELHMIRGDSAEIRVVVEETDPDTDVVQPVDLTLASAVAWTAKLDYGDADVDAVFAKTLGAGTAVVDGPAGKLDLTLSPADTTGPSISQTGSTRLVWDLQITLGSRKFTASRGTLTVHPEVTRA